MSAYSTSKFLFKFDHIKVFNSVCNYLYNLDSSQEIFPLRLFVYPSGRCNDSCRYCAEKRKYDSKMLDFFENKEHIDKLIDDIKESEIKDVHLFGGGEPFFYKDNMVYFLEKMHDVDTFIRIITNGLNLSDTDIKHIVENGLISQLNITLNADSEDSADKLYLNKERYNHTLFILEKVEKYKKLYRTRFPLVDIMFVLCNINYNRIINIISILKRFDINYFFIQPLRIDCEDHKRLLLSEEQRHGLSLALPVIEESLKEANIRSNIRDFQINKNFIENSRDHKSVVPNTVLTGKNLKIGCYFPLITFAILANGTLPKCYYSKQVYAKDYISIPSLSEYIQSKEYVDFVSRFIGEGCLSNCGDCNICLLWEIEEIKKNFHYFMNNNR